MIKSNIYFTKSKVSYYNHIHNHCFYYQWLLIYSTYSSKVCSPYFKGAKSDSRYSLK